MTKKRPRLDIPQKPAERRAWIQYRLRLIGSNFRALGRKLGVSQQAVSYAAAGYPSLAIEAAIAEAIGVPHQELFPEHFDDAGGRIPLARTRQRKPSRPAPQRNVEKPEAA